jgi:hypothetical protein
LLVKPWRSVVSQSPNLGPLNPVKKNPLNPQKENPI